MISMSCGMTVTKLALHPREHAETLDVVDDRVHEEGAVRPSLAPLRVHEGGVHGPVQELLVEQDAVDVLHCGSTQNRLFGPERAICACHSSRKNKITIFFQEKYCPEIIMIALPEFGGLLQDPGYALPEILVKIKNSGW